MIFVINLQNLLLLILLNGFKEKYQRINLFFFEFVYHGVSRNNNKTFKVRIVLIYSKVLHEIGDESPNIKKIFMIIGKIMGKENKQNNAIQIDKIIKPDKTISIKIVKISKKGEDRNIKKKYILSNSKLII